MSDVYQKDNIIVTSKNSNMNDGYLYFLLFVYKNAAFNFPILLSRRRYKSAIIDKKFHSQISRGLLRKQLPPTAYIASCFQNRRRISL